MFYELERGFSAELQPNPRSWTTYLCNSLGTFAPAVRNDFVNKRKNRWIVVKTKPLQLEANEEKPKNQSLVFYQYRLTMLWWKSSER